MSEKKAESGSVPAISPDALAKFLAGLEKTGLIKINRDRLELK